VCQDLSQCLNGDGTGKKTHIYLIFVVIEGEYDALLTWPFQQMVVAMKLRNVIMQKLTRLCC